jgi:diacylglycerol kinase (ATP)
VREGHLGVLGRLPTVVVMERRFERAALVVNTGARTGRQAYDEARHRLRDLDVPLLECYPVDEPARLVEVLQHLVDKEADLVCVGGGDGTMSTAVDHLAHRGITLGVLPLGTANDFARTLQIPTTVRSACETIARGHVVDIDLGKVGDNHFVNVASLGLSIGVTEALHPRLKRRLGAAAYPIATVTAYRQHVPFSAWLEFPEGDHEPVRLDNLLQLAVGNGVHYGGGNVMSPTAGIDDHLLDVYAISKGRFRDHVSVARLLRDGSFVEHDTVLHLTTRSVTVRAEPEQRVNVDGEVVTTTPETFTVDRNALDVVVPPGFTAARRDRSHPRGLHVREM